MNCDVCGRDIFPRVSTREMGARCLTHAVGTVAGASDVVDAEAERALAQCFRRNHLINMAGACATCAPTPPRVMCGCGNVVAMRCVEREHVFHRACITCVLTDRHGATADCAWVAV